MSKKNDRKYIFVLGGVMSGVGKGVTTASIATILESKGFRTSPIKADPYLNVDAGTMNPTEHGEVFVLGSGLECDQDMGNYERFLGRNLPPENYMTNGMVFKHVIDKERALGYDGKCVEPTYHITEEIVRRIEVASEKTDSDITIVEIGGTVGEYQNAIFIEAARTMKNENPGQVMFALVSYLPIPATIGEMKTKPTQNAVRQINSYGVTPDIIIARATVPVDQKRKQKISNTCGIPAENVISAPDVDSIYDVPVNFEDDGLSSRILDFFNTEPRKKDLTEWRNFVKQMKDAEEEIDIAIVGKYFDTGDFLLSDAYISVIEALTVSAAHAGVKATVHWLDSKEYEGEGSQKALDKLDDYDGILVPGGFGTTGIDGKVNVIQFARENKIPYFGLCYGMQLAVVEYARNMADIKDAHTTEIDPDTADPVIDVMPEQIKNIEDGHYGGTMRLGEYTAQLDDNTIAKEAYGSSEIVERHRHRYEVNPEYVEDLEKAGLIFSGKSPDGKLMEITELSRDDHPFFVGVQFHPEFTARVLTPHPLFSAFIDACVTHSKHTSDDVIEETTSVELPSSHSPNLDETAIQA